MLAAGDLSGPETRTVVKSTCPVGTDCAHAKNENTGCAVVSCSSAVAKLATVTPSGRPNAASCTFRIAGSSASVVVLICIMAYWGHTGPGGPG